MVKVNTKREVFIEGEFRTQDVIEKMYTELSTKERTIEEQKKFRNLERAMDYYYGRKPVFR